MADPTPPLAGGPPDPHLETAQALMQCVSWALHSAPFDGRSMSDPEHRFNSGVSHVNWDLFIELAFAHRLANLVAPHLASLASDRPETVLASFGRFRDVTSRMNAANLLTMRKIIPAFVSAGIPVLAFKGPIIQQIAYGSLFVRPASDLDLLVSPQLYQKSGAVLEACGYQLADECRSAWWTTGLGEQHFFSTSKADVTVDLHHRLQQPGCPLPKHPERFIALRRPISVGGQDIPTLSAVHGQLLSAMSYVKALHHREPAARYAIDFVAIGRGQGANHSGELQDEAVLQGLARTLALTQRAAAALLPDLVSSTPVPAVLDQVSDRQLWDMTLNPGLSSTLWPRRRTLLRDLYDRKRDYPIGLGQMVGSELLRQAAAKSGRPAT